MIVVVTGHGEFGCDAGSLPVGPGDVVVVSPGEPHQTRNTGASDLESLCFFPVGDLARVTTELPVAD